MKKKFTTEEIDLIVHLSRLGKSPIEITKETGINYSSVRSIIRRIIGVADRASSEKRKMYDQMAIDRLTMTSIEVGIKYGITTRYVNQLLQKHPEKGKFKMIRQKADPKLKSRPNTRIKTKVTEPIDKPSMQKGHFKLQKNEKIFQTKQPKAMRSVPMYDSKNTIKFVELDDPRSNEEIRSAWKESEEKKFKNLSA